MLKPRKTKPTAPAPLNQPAHRLAVGLAVGALMAALVLGLSEPVLATSLILAAAAVLLLTEPVTTQRQRLAHWLAIALGGLALVSAVLSAASIADIWPLDTSLVILLIAIGVGAIDTKREWLTQVLAPLAFLGALISLTENFYDVQSLQSHPLLLSTSQALPVLLVSAAAFFARPKRDGMDILLDAGSAGYMLRRMQAGAILVPLAMGWLQIQSQKYSWYPAETGITVLVVAITMVFSYVSWMCALLIYRSERRRQAAEEQARQEEHQFKVIMDSLPVGVALVHLPSGRVDIANPALIELVGLDPAKHPDGLNPASLFKVNGAPYPYDELPLVQSLEEGKTIVKNDVILHRGDGAHIPLRVTGAPFGARQEQEQTGLLIVEDYTKGLEIEKAKEEFLSLATHQLQTPLAAVKGFLAMLRDGAAGPLNAEQADLVNDAYDSNQRESQIVSELLNAGRAESGRMVLSKTPTDLSAMTNSVITEQQAVITSRHQTITITAPAKPVMETLDAARFRMCLENLVSNASKYTENGGRITITLAQTTRHTTVAVADSGVGIAKADLVQLFKRFSRIDNKLSQKVGGTGLGLYLVRQIMELHGGRARVDSVLGKGTTFTLEVPRT